MVDPLSVSIGAGASVVAILAALGLYYAGRAPDHIINMREVDNYYRHVSAHQALQDDVGDQGGDA